MRWFRSTGLRLLLALGLSFALWVFVSFSLNPDQSTSFDDVPVAIQGISPGLVLVDTNGLPRTSLPSVDITVQADSQTLSRVQSNDIQAFVDLQNVDAGEHVVIVVAEADRSDLNGLTFSSITPGNVSLRLEEVLTTTVPITVQIEGNLPFSFERGIPQITQESQPITQTQVVGPGGRVAQVRTVRAITDIEQLRADYTASVALQPLDENGTLVQGVTVKPETVNVRIPIRSVAGLRRVAVLGQVTGYPAPGFVVRSITSEPQLVNLTGSSGPLDAVNEIETEPIDIANATGTISREVSLLLPIGTSLQVGQPSRVVVTVEVVPLSRPFTVQFPVPLDVQNLGGGLTYTLTDPTVTVTLSGTDAALARLGNTPLRAEVDVGGLGVGVHVVTPVVQPPEGIRIVGAVPNVTITLRAAVTTTPVPTRTEAPLPQTPQPTESTPAGSPTAEATPQPSPTVDAPTPTEAPNASGRPAAPAETPVTSSPPAPTATRSDTTFPPETPSPTTTPAPIIQ